MGMTNNNTYQRYDPRFSNNPSYHFCHKCDKKFIEGETIYHKRGRNITKTYHEKCWKSLLL